MTVRVRRVVTDRRGGHSRPPYDAFNLGDGVGDEPAHVHANRQRLTDALGAPDVVWMEQIHGRTVRRVDGPQDGPVEGCDAVVSTTVGLVLVALAADCVPMLFADQTAGVIAAAHAGRLGVRLGIAARTVEAMVDAGAAVERIDVLLGPAICGRCYEVPAEMRADVARVAPGSATSTAKGTPGLDLRAGLRGQLEALGVDQIAVDPRCTAEDRALFSHRRDGVTGRQAGVVWLS